MDADVPQIVHFVAGAIAGTAAVCATLPLDLIKIRLQSSGGSLVKQLAASSGKQILTPQYLLNVIRSEGAPALMKGLPIDLLTGGPTKALYFGSYSMFKRFYNDMGVFGNGSTAIHLLSAASASVATVSVGNPMWLVKVRIQLERQPLSIKDCVKRVYAERGIRGFYAGISSTYLGIFGTSINFAIYEQLRKLVDVPFPGTTGEDKARKFVNYLLAGAAARVISSTINYPNTVITTRMREGRKENRKYFSAMMSVYREGSSAYYRGMGIQIIRSAPVSAITLGTYELVVLIIQSFINGPAGRQEEVRADTTRRT